MSRVMKDSGMEWIGEVPAGWSVVLLSSIFSERKNRNNGQVESNLLSLSYGRIIQKSIDTKEGLLPQSFETYNIIEAGDIVLRLTDLQNDKRSLRTGLCNEKGIITSAYITLKPKVELVSRYMHFYLHAFDINKGFYGMGDGVRQSLNYNELKKLQILLPPLHIQYEVADYLENMNEQVEKQISLLEESIFELQAYKQSIITEAVTKGLDPDVPMKDSGVDWIGEIPEHWNVSMIKNELDCYDHLRKPISAELRVNELSLYDYYGASGVIDKIDDYNVEGRMLLIGEDGANLVYRNLPLIYKAEGRFWVNNHAHILKEKAHNDYDYVAYLLEAGDYTSYITGSAQPKLSQENLMRFKILRIPMNEQTEIVAYLDSKVKQIDSLINLKNQKAEALKEYKQSLVYECVTGKRDCREGSHADA